MKFSLPWLWASLAAIFGLKLMLVAALPIHIVFSPHDDSLYLSRALHLLNDGSFGPYDSRVLAKLPGMSIWLAGLRALGLPYLITMNLLYAGAGLYVLFGLRRCGMHGLVLLAIWALYLLNPVSMSEDWLRILREPLSAILLVTLLGAALHILVCVREGRRFWPHLLVFCGTFVFSMLLREEDKLLWGLLLMFAGAVFLDGLAQGRNPRWSLRRIAPLLVVPALVALGSDFALRQAVESRYGLPILHDYGEGEFPRLLAAIRSIDSKHDNRLVMVTQEALARLRTVAPQFVPVIDGLPPPGPGTYSCRLQGVCTEWSNGWMPFWIRDAAFRAGLTPTLPAAQEYFREARLDIERACHSDSLKCTPRGGALVPPMELRWARAYVAEAWRLAGITLRASSLISVHQLIYDVPMELERKFHLFTTADRFDTQHHAGFAYQAVAPVFGLPLARIREQIVTPYQVGAGILLLAGLLVFARRLWALERESLSPLAAVTIVVGLYFLARFAILSYVAVFMGTFEPRMMFTTFTVGVLLALPFIYDSSRQKQGNA